LLDFDYSGAENKRTYPQGFNLLISDGERHPEVKEGELLHRDHDVFALKWMLKQYIPMSIDSLQWSAWVDELDEGWEKAIELIEKIEKIGNVLLESTSANLSNR
jgi:hypothetical protein